MTAVAQYTITSLNDIVTSDMPPENPYFGMLWVNTSTVPPETMVWDGQGWVVQNDLEELRGVVSTHTERFSEFQSSVDGLNSYVGSLTETVETLEDSLGNEHTKVLEMQSAVSELEQTVHGLTITVEEQFAGGINYVKIDPVEPDLEAEYTYCGSKVNDDGTYAAFIQVKDGIMNASATANGASVTFDGTYVINYSAVTDIDTPDMLVLSYAPLTVGENVITADGSAAESSIEFNDPSSISYTLNTTDSSFPRIPMAAIVNQDGTYTN